MTEPSPDRGTFTERGRAAFRLGLALALLLLSVSPGVAETAGAPPQRWVLTRNSLSLIADADPALAQRLFATRGSAVLGGWDGAATAMSWPSYAAFAAAVAAGTIPPNLSTAMFDPEGWAATPAGERRDPVRYMRLFAALAHAHGYTVILTPHPNLTTVPGAACPQREGEPMEDAYLRCRIPALAARYADILDVQTQYLESDPARYARVVELAARQARQANPDIVVVSHLSTTFATSANELYAAWSSVQGVVDGHYLGMPDGLRADVAAEFIRMIASQSA